MQRIQNLKYYYKQATKPVALVALTIGFVGVLIGAAGLFMAVKYGQLHQQLVAEKRASDQLLITLQLESDRDDILRQNSVYPLTYQVKAGDSLWKIAQQFYGSGYDYKILLEANNLDNPDQLHVGQELLIPAPNQENKVIGSNQIQVDSKTNNKEVASNNIVKTDDSTKSASSLSRENLLKNQNQEEHFTYQVESGDSLWFIALKYYDDGSKWTEIYANNIDCIGSNPDLIYPGSKLNL